MPLLLALAACGSDDAEGSSTGALATTTILGSIAGDVAACADASARALMPIGVDPHDYQASSSDVADMVAAELVVANGLGLEEGLEDALASAEQDGATVLEVAPLVDPIPFAEGEGDAHSDEEGHSDEEKHSEEEEHSGGEEHSDEEEHGHEEGELDPHFWHDAARGAAAAAVIGDAWAEATGDDAYADCGAQVEANLLTVDDEVRTTLEVVAEPDRLMVTDHDAFGYFAEAYDFEVVGTLIPAGSTLAEPSSAELAELVETIEQTGARAIFTNSANPSDLADAVATEVGYEVAVVELYVGSLGEEGSGAETYPGMVRNNASRIAEALA